MLMKAKTSVKRQEDAELVVKKEFIKMKTKDLIPYENNPRHNEEAVPDVAESIRQCGDLDPIEVDENNVILSGHTRLLAL